MASTSQAGNNNDLQVVETDPSGQYVRFNKILGEGATKKVYLGFDGFSGIEIAWSKTQVTEEIMTDEVFLTSLCAEAILLKKFDHENIMRCYKSWVDEDNKIINMISEYFTSGNLIEYIKKHNLVVNKMAIKNWSRQILEGLHYLHCRRHPIVHCDVKCENIFINGITGVVKLGDFGLVVILEREIKSYAGTPEFMAPEVFGFSYDQLVDIYSFGMSVLQMVTRESPYGECRNNDQIFAKIKSGEMPVALSKVTDPEVKEFIEKCLAPASDRPTAVDLLNDPFLAPSVSSTLTACRSLSPRESVHDQDRLCEKHGALSIVTDPDIKEFVKCLAPASNRPGTVDLLNDPFLAPSVSSTLTASSRLSPRESVRDQVRLCEKPDALSIVTDPLIKEFIEKYLAPASDRPASVDLLNDPLRALSASNTLTACRSLSLREPVADEEDRLLRKKFELRGSMNDENVSISMCIELVGHDEKKEFVYLVGTDTIESVMKKLAKEYGMSTGDVILVSEQMETLIIDLYSPHEAQPAIDTSSEQDKACSQHNQAEEQEHGKSETEVNRQQEIQEREGEDRT